MRSVVSWLGGVTDTGYGIAEATGPQRFLKLETNMQIVKAIADGSNEVQQRAASDANAVQTAVNLTAVVGCWHRHLLAMHRQGICGDDLNNHPVNLAFVSKLNSLCRVTTEREMAAFRSIDQLERGETAEYEVIPI